LGFDANDPKAYARPFKYDEAIKIYGRNTGIVRWNLHKALNSVVQGSSADMIKVALVLCRRAGFIPHITVHDENDYSFKSRKDAKIVHDIMVNDTAKYLKLTVPLKVDVELGHNWGHCEKVVI
jgi:DNA polymerase I-like protein with 3'-5' exonuclease and polymerase domains